MAEFPALPLWTDAYLADCSHLSDAEHGRYMMLLFVMWRTPDCRLPNDDAWLARKFRRTEQEVREQLRPLITEFCDCDGNWIFQKRLIKERAHVTKSSKKQSVRAKSRWNKEKDQCHGNAQMHQSGNAPTPTPTPTPQIEGYSGRDVIADFDRLRVEAFGEAQARLYPNSLDLVIANRWLEEGATGDLIRSVFASRFERQKAEGRRPSDTLSHMQGAIADALAEAARPMPEGSVSQPRAGPVVVDLAAMNAAQERIRKAVENG